MTQVAMFSGGFSNARVENVLESELELLLKAELMWLLCVCTSVGRQQAQQRLCI
jgi:hypothetical protein